MISIDERYVDGLAPNAGAIKNGRDLVRKGKIVALNRSEDETVYFGECKGSGKSNYFCSMDFAKPEAPTSRCSCPSRQFPCKHCLGLLYAVAQGKKVSVAEIPADLAGKREKAASRAVAKKVASKAPKKVNKSALKKKIAAQLEGLDLLETLVHDLTRAGIGSLNAKSASAVRDQAKQLGNAYLPGAQAALNRFLGLFTTDMALDESSYTEALDLLTRVHALVKQGRTYLQARLDDPELKPETNSAIAAWLGHAWQLQELRETGLMQPDAELIQLAFHSCDDAARKEYVDTGIWFNLTNPAIQFTQTFRPYKAVKYIREDDSVFHRMKAPELFVYPGDLNPRIRWEQAEPHPVEPTDLARVREGAHATLATVVKEVRGQLKTPLADKNPLALLRFSKIGRIGQDCVVEDREGARLTLTDRGAAGEPTSLHMLPALPAEARTDQAVLLRFHHDLDTHTLMAKPLSVVTGNEIYRLTF